MYFSFFIILIILGFSLNKDYNKDKGQHKRAKILHAICLILLAFSFQGSITRLFRFIGAFNEIKSDYLNEKGIFPGQLDLLVEIACVVLSAVVVVLIYQMSARRINARKWFLKLFPWLIGFMGLKIVKDATKNLEGLEYYATYLIYIGVFVATAIILVIYYMIYRFYKSVSVEKFFYQNQEDEGISDTDALDSGLMNKDQHVDRDTSSS